MFATSLFFRAVDPIIPQIAADLNEPIGSVALLATAFALPYALMQPVLGALADVIGKTRMMFACLVLVTIATFAGAFATTLPQLMVTRIVSGIVAGGLFPISLALVADVVPIEQRQVAISRLLAGAMLGNLLGASPSGIVDGFHRLARRVHRQRLCRGRSHDRGVHRLWRTGSQAADARSISAQIIPAATARSSPIRWPNSASAACSSKAYFCSGMYPFVAPLLHDAGETRASIAGIVIGGFGDRRHHLFTDHRPVVAAVLGSAS